MIEFIIYFDRLTLVPPFFVEQFNRRIVDWGAQDVIVSYSNRQVFCLRFEEELYWKTSPKNAACIPDWFNNGHCETISRLICASHSVSAQINLAEYIRQFVHTTHVMHFFIIVIHSYTK